MKVNADMSYTIVYYHRIHFPSASGQTIQVLRDYYPLSGQFGHTVHLLYRSPGELDTGRINADLKHYGAGLSPSFQLHCIRDGWFGTARTLRKVKGLINASPVPVIIAVRTMDHARRAVSLRNRIRRTRPVIVILELHETAIPHMVYHQDNRPLKAYFSLSAEKKIFAQVDGIVCTAPPQLSILDDRFPHHAPAVILPNSYDPSFFSSGSMEKPPRASSSPFHLRYAGQFTAWKNTHIIIEALSHLPEHVVLDLAGGKLEAQEETKRQLLTLAKEYGVEDRVTYAGFLPPSEVSRFLSEADCLLLPLGDNVQSRFFTSPMKLFEYAASDVPMIVTRQPTTESLITDGIHAVMVDPGSARKLADAVIRLADDPVLGQTLAKNARLWAGQYTAANRTSHYNQFIDSLMDRL